jgi:hypothetical protein
MKKFTLLAIAILLFTACPAEMWIPLQAAPRTPTSFEHVQYLQEPPTRPFIEIGIITPPSNEYETLAEAVHAMRKEASKHGADAIFIESQTAHEGWSFSVGRWGGGGGSGENIAYRVKAIAWK